MYSNTNLAVEEVFAISGKTTLFPEISPLFPGNAYLKDLEAVLDVLRVYAFVDVMYFTRNTVKSDLCIEET